MEKTEKRPRMAHYLKEWSEEKIHLLREEITTTNLCGQIGRLLKVLENKIPRKCSPNNWQHFKAIVKNGTFNFKLINIDLGNSWRILGYFLLQHLVTLLPPSLISRAFHFSPKSSEIKTKRISN